MSYKTYRAGVERARAALQAELSQANDLRGATHLPVWDIQAEFAQQCPLLTEEAWTAQHQEQKAFARFRRGQLAGEVMPTTPTEADWEQVRATGLRRAYLEHQIRQTWLTQPHAGTSKPSPHHL